MNSNRISNYLQEIAAQYESQAIETGWHAHEIMFGLMYEFVKPDETLLDIGIGTGLSSSLFHKAGLQISGFDSSTEMLERCGTKNFSGEVMQHDLRNVPFPYETDSFDHIISIAVFNFLSDLVPVFKEVARIIKSNGIFGFAIEEKKLEQKAQYAMCLNSGAEQGSDGQFKIDMYRHSDKHVRSLLDSVGFFVLKDLEFSAGRHPGQGIDVYKVYVAQKQE